METERLRTYIGQKLVGVRRIHYVLQDQIDTSAGPIELRFSSGLVLLCDAGPDGESIALGDQSWVDPFVDRMTEENEEYVRQHGKWIALDTSERPEFNQLIGSEVFDISRIMGTTGKTYGILINIYGASLAAYVVADELHVARLP